VAEAVAKTLVGKRLLVTRAVEQSESLVAALREMGALPICLPLVAFAPPDDPDPLDEAIRQLEKYDWVFLTSQNALRALQQRCAHLNLSLAKATAGGQIAAVGPATAEASLEAGLQVAYVAVTHQGVSLAAELSARVKGKKIFLPHSDRASRDIVDVLKDSGAVVTDVVAYKTVLPSGKEKHQYEAIMQQGADAVLFFSPSAVHHLLELEGRAKFLALSQQAVFAAIGPITEKALREAGVQRLVRARDTTVAAAIAVLSEYYSMQGQGLPAGVKPG
jgi:uroporphyrinogen-III synthase